MRGLIGYKLGILRKVFISLLAVVLAAGCLGACGSESASADRADGKLQIVTTIFPEYDWVMNILGDAPAGAEVTMLLDSGVDLHSYQPTADDILKVSTCDLFIYVGGESDKWAEDALKEAINKDMVVVDLIDALGDRAKEEEIVEGMEAEDEEEDGPEYDEHVWLSLRNASYLVDRIVEAIELIDPENAEIYRENAAGYNEKLRALDEDYLREISSAEVSTLLFGDRFPFRYLTDDYNLSYYAAFSGCSAETEASFETVTFLAKKADELGLNAVMTMEGTDHRVAETIVNSTSSKTQRILTMDSMQSTTSADVENGVTYLAVMENDLEVLKEALK